MIDEQQANEARDRLVILDRAKAYSDLVQSVGWRQIQRLQEAWLMDLLSKVKACDSMHPEAYQEVVVRWQMAEKLVDLQSAEIDQTLKDADTIRGALGIEEALLMEQLQNERKSASGDPGTADSASYLGSQEQHTY